MSVAAAVAIPTEYVTLLRNARHVVALTGAGISKESGLPTFREAQNYIRAYQRGLGVHELPPYLAWPDWEQWDPLLEWLDSRRSQAAR